LLLEKEAGVTDNSYYEATVARPPPAPPLAGTVAADVCVVGGGYAGISCALELAQRGYSVVLLEAKRLGWGSSGRNGGQVIVGVGSDGECAIEDQLPAEDARRIWDISIEGLRLVQERITRYRIDCDYRPGYLSLVVKPRRWPALERWARHVTAAYGYPLEFIGPDTMRDWVASERFHSAVFDAGSGHLHPLKYCLGLAGAAKEAGVRIFENSAVCELRRGAQAEIVTTQGTVRARFVVLAGNVYLDEYGDVARDIEGRIMPVGTYILATESMGRQRADALMRNRPAASDTNFILDYFRLSADDRLLFGAGESYSGSTPRNLVARMRERMLGVFPQLHDLSVTHWWGGFVDMTMNQAPDFGRLGANIYYLQGFSGHGLALSGMAGRLAAEAVDGQASRFDLFARIRHHSFPGGRLMRTPGLVLAMLYYRFLDWL
jgi:gamma-glutamylputrescine oxidase